MNPAFEWGLEFMQALQQAVGAVGVDLAQVFTFMGNQEFYLLLFPLLFWCIDGAIGARVTILYLLSVVLNTNIKDAVAQPRPCVIDPNIALAVHPRPISAWG